MGAEHNRRLLRQSLSGHLEMPCMICQGICHSTGDISREALVAVCVVERKCDRIRAVSGDSPISLFIVSSGLANTIEKGIPNPTHRALREEYPLHCFHWEGHDKSRRRFQKSWNKGQMEGFLCGKSNVPVLDSICIAALN